LWQLVNVVSPTRDPTLAQIGNENGKRHSYIVEFLSTWCTVSESAFLINAVHPVTGMPEFPTRHISCILRECNEKLACVIRCRIFNSAHRHDFSFLLPNIPSLCANAISSFSLSFIGKIRFFSNWNSIECRKGRNRDIVINSPHGSCKHN